MNLTNYLAYYLIKIPALITYFDILRDLFLFSQLIIIIIFILKKRKRYLFFFFVFVFITIFLLTWFLKLFFPFLRPISFFNISEQILYDSFPSRHTAISFALSFALITENLALAALSFGFSVLIAIFSWLSLKHWPIDIIFGFFLGLFVFWLNLKILNFFKRFDF